MATTVLRTVASAVAGGTASLLGGGKFANGAFSGAFVYLFNHNLNVAKEELRRQQALGKQGLYIGHGKGINGYYVTDGKSIYYPDNAQTRASAEAFGNAIKLPYYIIGGGLLARVGTAMYYFVMSHPIETMTAIETANDIYNPSLPPTTPIGQSKFIYDKLKERF